ncbi:hypothetical protein FOA52_007485 [Chlamydomonas sp. UWO 241]|nr:hypothetical protein FOA52_007485 [Chlamydomonas sp. UWO 241]
MLRAKRPRSETGDEENSEGMLKLKMMRHCEVHAATEEKAPGNTAAVHTQRAEHMRALATLDAGGSGNGAGRQPLREVQQQQHHHHNHNQAQTPPPPLLASAGSFTGSSVTGGGGCKPMGKPPRPTTAAPPPPACPPASLSDHDIDFPDDDSLLCCEAPEALFSPPPPPSHSRANAHSRASSPEPHHSHNAGMDPSSRSMPPPPPRQPALGSVAYAQAWARAHAHAQQKEQRAQLQLAPMCPSSSGPAAAAMLTPSPDDRLPRCTVPAYLTHSAHSGSPPLLLFPAWQPSASRAMVEAARQAVCAAYGQVVTTASAYNAYNAYSSDDSDSNGAPASSGGSVVQQQGGCLNPQVRVTWRDDDLVSHMLSEQALLAQAMCAPTLPLCDIQALAAQMHEQGEAISGAQAAAAVAARAAASHQRQADEDAWHAQQAGAWQAQARLERRAVAPRLHADGPGALLAGGAKSRFSREAEALLRMGSGDADGDGLLSMSMADAFAASPSPPALSDLLGAHSASPDGGGAHEPSAHGVPMPLSA